MKKFNFKLKVVLRERTIREDERKKELALSLKKLNAEKEILSKLTKKKESLFAAMKHEKQLPVPDIKLLRQYETYMLQMNRLIQEQHISVAGAAQNLQQSQLRLSEASIRKKVLEKLKEHQQHKYYLNMEKNEMKDMDEFNMIRANK